MFALEDSGLILSAEGPLGVLFGVHDPGDTGMRLGVLVHFRGLQLEMKERKSALGHRASEAGTEQVGTQHVERLLLCPKMPCAGKQLSLRRHLSPSQLKHF